MQKALKYIKIVFIICSRACHANTQHTTFSLVFVKGKRLRSQTKEIVANVCNYFEDLNKCKRTEGSLKRTADVTGVSRGSIKRLRKGKVDIGEAAFSTPTKRC